MLFKLAGENDLLFCKEKCGLQQRGSEESSSSYECECVSFSTLVANNLRAPGAKGQILIRLGIIDCHSALAQLRPLTSALHPPR